MIAEESCMIYYPCLWAVTEINGLSGSVESRMRVVCPFVWASCEGLTALHYSPHRVSGMHAK